MGWGEDNVDDPGDKEESGWDRGRDWDWDWDWDRDKG